MIYPLSDSYTEVKIFDWIHELKKFETNKNKQYIKILELVMFRSINYRIHHNDVNFIEYTTISGDTGDIIFDTINAINIYVPLIVDDVDKIFKITRKIQDICIKYIDKKAKL